MSDDPCNACEYCRTTGAANASAEYSTLPLQLYVCDVAIDVNHITCVRDALSAMGAVAIQEHAYEVKLFVDHAVRLGSLATLQVLHEFGISPSTLTLDLAAMQNHTEIAEFLLDLGVELTPAAIHDAAECGALDCLHLFYTRGLLDADVCKDIKGAALRCGRAHIVRWLHHTCRVAFDADDLHYARQYVAGDMSRSDVPYAYNSQPSDWHGIVTFLEEFVHACACLNSACH